jgi:hypothetical protein
VLWPSKLQISMSHIVLGRYDIVAIYTVRDRNKSNPVWSWAVKLRRLSRQATLAAKLAEGRYGESNVKVR